MTAVVENGRVVEDPWMPARVADPALVAALVEIGASYRGAVKLADTDPDEARDLLLSGPRGWRGGVCVSVDGAVWDDDPGTPGWIEVSDPSCPRCGGQGAPGGPCVCSRRVTT